MVEYSLSPVLFVHLPDLGCRKMLVHFGSLKTQIIKLSSFQNLLRKLFGKDISSFAVGEQRCRTFEPTVGRLGFRQKVLFKKEKTNNTRLGF